MTIASQNFIGGNAMKKKMYLLTALVSVLTFAFIISSSIEAKVRISKKRITLNVSEKHTLRLKGAKSGVKWKSSNPKVAKVSKKGKVTAIRRGKTTITAKTEKKKYKCVVSVKGTDTQSMITPVPDIIVKKPGVPTPTSGMAAPADTALPTPSPDTEPTPTPDAPAPTPHITDAEWAPGEVNVCFTDDCPESAKNEIFSKLDIVEKSDLLEGIYNNLKKTEGADSEKVAEFEKELGKRYIIVLSDKSREAVIAAITMLIKEPYVKYAEPDYICEPAI